MDPVVAPEVLLTENADRVLLDARPGPEGRAAYEAERLAGSFHIDLDDDLSGDASAPERGGRHPLPALPDFGVSLGRRGIAPTTFVVLYDAMGGIKAAARGWWLLQAVGHSRVAILDGGIEAARAAGVPMESGPSRPLVDGAPYPVPNGWQGLTTSLDEVRSRGEGTLLLDVRAERRYRGDEEPFDPVAGHIPGAVNMPVTGNLDAEGRFLSASELRGRYGDRVASNKQVVVSCGSGVTACHTLAALRRAGYPDARLYVGSFSEWCRSEEPIESGGDAL